MQHRDKPEIDVVLFDVGGVLVELSGIETMIEWLGTGISAEELWVRWLRSEAVRRFETGGSEADEFALHLTREFAIDIDPGHFITSFSGWPLGLYPGAIDLVARIPPRYRRALLSNSNALHWPRIVGEMGLGAAFEHRFASHLTGKIKPDAAAFEDVVATLKCAPHEVLFLDDNRLNVDAAQSIGMHAARVIGPTEAQRVLAEFGIIEDDADSAAS